MRTFAVHGTFHYRLHHDQDELLHSTYTVPFMTAVPWGQHDSLSPELFPFAAAQPGLTALIDSFSAQNTGWG